MAQDHMGKPQGLHRVVERLRRGPRDATAAVCDRGHVWAIASRPGLGLRGIALGETDARAQHHVNGPEEDSFSGVSLDLACLLANAA